MRRVIEVEIPEKIAVLLEKNPTLRSHVESIAREEIIRYISMLLEMDKLTKDSELTEEDIMKLDKKIKRAIRKKIENEINR